MNKECKVTKRNGGLYNTVMGPTSAIFPVLCGSCITDKSHTPEIVKQLKESFDDCAVCGESYDYDLSGDQISQESRDAANGWGWKIDARYN